MAGSSTSGMTPEMRKLLHELGRAQIAYGQYGNSGRKDLQANAHQYADQLRSQAQGMGVDLAPYADHNQWGQDFARWYEPSNSGPAGKYDATKDGYSLRTDHQMSPSTGGPGDSTGGPDTGKPQTTPLPSSQFKGTLSNQPPIDTNGIQSRAQRDAHMSISAMMNQANQGYNRFSSEGQSQIQSLQNMYSGEYRKNQEATQLSARDAVSRSAMRGFLSSGLAADAEQKANTRGEQMRMDLAAQEKGQIGEITNRINQAGQSRNDTLAQLTSQEQDMISQLTDKYMQQAQDNNFRERSLDTSTALSLLGMDTQVQQFDQGLSWDKNKFGQQLSFDSKKWNDQLGQFDRQLSEQIAQRMQQGDQFGQDLGMRDKWHGQDNQLGRDQLGYQDKWNGWERDYKTNSLALQRDNQGSDNAYRAAELKLKEKGMSYDNFFKWAGYTQGKDDKQFAQNQLTSKYMDEADWMMSQLKSGNPDAELKTRGIKSADDIVRWYADRGMKITSEGGNLTELIKYIRQRSGGGYSSQGTGPMYGNPAQNPFDPYGLYRK